MTATPVKEAVKPMRLPVSPTWLQAVHDGHTIWDIGQLPRGVKARLRRAAKRGEIEEGRGHWMNLGRPRFFWRAM